MIPLDKDLQQIKGTLGEFGEITRRVLQYLPNVNGKPEKKNDYLIYSSKIAGYQIYPAN